MATLQLEVDEDEGAPPPLPTTASHIMRKMKLQQSSTFVPLAELPTTSESHPAEGALEREEELVKELQKAHREIEKAHQEKLEVSQELGNVLLQLQETQNENEKLRVEKLAASEQIGELVLELQRAQVDLEKLKALSGMDIAPALDDPESEVELAGVPMRAKTGN